MTTCPENMDCPMCTSVSNDCTESNFFKLGSCKSGYEKDDFGRCVKNCVVDCGDEFDSSTYSYENKIYSIADTTEEYETCNICSSYAPEGYYEYYKAIKCKEGFRLSGLFGYNLPELCFIEGKQTNCENFGDLLYVNKNIPSEKVCFDAIIPEEIADDYELIGFVANPEKRIALFQGILVTGFYNVAWEKLNISLPAEDYDYLMTNKKTEHQISGKAYTQAAAEACQNMSYYTQLCDSVEAVLEYSTIGTNAGDWFIPSIYDLEDYLNKQNWDDKAHYLFSIQSRLDTSGATSTPIKNGSAYVKNIPIVSFLNHDPFLEDAYEAVRAYDYVYFAYQY